MESRNFGEGFLRQAVGQPYLAEAIREDQSGALAWFSSGQRGPKLARLTPLGLQTISSIGPKSKGGDMDRPGFLLPNRACQDAAA